jgi:hypothetical protein
MANSSTYIMDLPENVTMSPFSEQQYAGRQNQDRSIDMESTSYRQMNPHQNPYIPGNPRMDSMPLPEYAGRGNGAGPGPNMSSSLPPPPMPPTYDYDQGPLGNSPQFSLPPKDIPLDMSGFRDESAKPNYIPPAQNTREDYVQEQEDRVREKTQSEETKKAINQKFDIIAQLQMPIVVAVLFWIFQIEKVNRLMARYLKFAGLFREDGTMNVWGITAKSVMFASAYFSVKLAIDSVA